MLLGLIFRGQRGVQGCLRNLESDHMCQTPFASRQGFPRRADASTARRRALHRCQNQYTCQQQVAAIEQQTVAPGSRRCSPQVSSPSKFKSAEVPLTSMLATWSISEKPHSPRPSPATRRSRETLFSCTCHALHDGRRRSVNANFVADRLYNHAEDMTVDASLGTSSDEDYSVPYHRGHRCEFLDHAPDQWRPFQNESSGLIERARSASQRTCEVKWGRYTYMIDLTSLMQENMQTGRKRRIRRVVPRAERGACAACWFSREREQELERQLEQKESDHLHQLEAERAATARERQRAEELEEEMQGLQRWLEQQQADHDERQLRRQISSAMAKSCQRSEEHERELQALRHRFEKEKCDDSRLLSSARRRTQRAEEREIELQRELDHAEANYRRQLEAHEQDLTAITQEAVRQRETLQRRLQQQESDHERQLDARRVQAMAREHELATTHGKEQQLLQERLEWQRQTLYQKMAWAHDRYLEAMRQHSEGCSLLHRKLLCSLDLPDLTILSASSTLSSGAGKVCCRQISDSNPEFLALQDMFKKSMTRHRRRHGSDIWCSPPDVEITSIEEVLDTTMQNLYEAARMEVRNRNPSGSPGITGISAWKCGNEKSDQVDLNEYLLFHGCSLGAIHSIARQGFDPQRGGTVAGGMFGVGTYFAENASKSEMETTCSKCESAAMFRECCHAEGERRMIVARVLLGNCHVVTAPDPHRKLAETRLTDPAMPFDSHMAAVREQGGAVDHPEFIIFKQQLALVRYVISYRHRLSCECHQCAERRSRPRS